MSQIAYGWDRYPVTVTADRYSGSYSGGEYLAFAEEPYEVPPDPWAGDPEAAAYWAGSLVDICVPEKRIFYEKGGRWHPDCVGRGNTPQEALDDLDKRMQTRDDRPWTKGDTQ